MRIFADDPDDDPDEDDEDDDLDEFGDKIEHDDDDDDDDDDGDGDGDGEDDGDEDDEETWQVVDSVRPSLDFRRQNCLDWPAFPALPETSGLDRRFSRLAPRGPISSQALVAG